MLTRIQITALLCLCFAVTGCDSGTDPDESGLNPVVLTTPLPDLVVLASDAAPALNLSTYFGHQDDPASLGFVATVTGDAATVTVSGTQLEIEPRFIGDISVTVRAVDASGNALSDTFEARVSARMLEGIEIPVRTWEMIIDGREYFSGAVYFDCRMERLPNHQFATRTEYAFSAYSSSESTGYQFASYAIGNTCLHGEDVQWDSATSSSAVRANASFREEGLQNRDLDLDSWSIDVRHRPVGTPPANLPGGEFRFTFDSGRQAVGAFG